MIKNILKGMLVITVLFSGLFFSLNRARAEDIKEDKSIEILFFGSPTCPHCLAEKQFLKELKEKHPEIILKEYEFSKNIDLANKLYESHKVPKNQQGLVPATFIDDVFFVGFSESTGNDIENHIKGLEIKKSSEIKIPFFGKVDMYKLSLPVLSIVLGIVDGFNVCSLGALVIILGLVLVLRSRKKILLLGGTFLLVTGLTYGLLIFMWHQLFSFISPYIKSMELLIGVLSMVGGIYLLREFIKSLKQGASCDSGGIVSKLSPKVEKIFSNKKSLAVLIGVVFLFSAIITIVEFPCSALLPVLFASILFESNLSLSSTLFYMAIFLLFYMLDELIVFLIAFFTMKIKIISPKFINTFNLIAALIFLFLGSYYLYRLF
ncbi:hypothetical protein CVU82_01915 [Candidatus Falkowbacteria bacterium HGW-Falkowbacteria-1]|uniref:Uncharacterized protein n=1 Tax=Candidatus Falkowbacteria bacterium HGW-Falkowbacteria-1 TaxID=2013768 RepID=A0A2N2E9B6_9BACT|nr:MAG: hypothetical protein CVU82_01915 [Candidatus Falkowbacteria bacterium HGW-Falkowbacteria-1]